MGKMITVIIQPGSGSGTSTGGFHAHASVDAPDHTRVRGTATFNQAEDLFAFLDELHPSEAMRFLWSRYIAQKLTFGVNVSMDLWKSKLHSPPSDDQEN